jgi:acetoacetyl-CoA synthetase
VLDRFGQVAPKVLFTADGYYYAGKTIDSLAAIDAVVAKLPSVSRVVVVPYISEDPAIAGMPKAVAFAQFGRSAAPLTFEQLPFDHPLYVLYSSGTTGVPKCIVHGAGGTLLQHLKEQLLHTDVKPGDRLFFFTTCGWMMWNWLASGLAAGATVVLYDGSPLHPRPGVLWEMAADESVTIFGASPKYLAALEKSGYRPRDRHSLSVLRTFLSTGSPLAPAQFDFVADAIGPDIQLASITGGTDIVSCFALGNPLLPVYRGEIQCRGLGMKVEVWNDEGRAVTDERGELVCTAPFPSMPIGFWNDADGSRYRAAYFERYPGVWHHGDYAILTARGGLVILGRSDAVLNPGGVRIGTAEIYRQVEQLDEVLEAVVVGQEWQNDVRVVLFVRLREGLELDEALRERIRRQIRSNTTPRHVPAVILQVPEIPRTISGKIVELAVREAIHGRPVKNTDALANPAALEHYRNRAELKS